jgi:hypothetical protein
MATESLSDKTPAKVETPKARKGAGKRAEDEMPGWLWWLPAAGLFFVVVYCFSQGLFTQAYFSALGVGVLAGGAALIFSSRHARWARPPSTRSNTNLEQISDWLAKILVGVGLVQLGAILDAMGNLADFLGPALGDETTGQAFALSLVVYFVVCGFLVPDEQLRDAVAAASPAVRAQIFARARVQRSASWQADKPRMERTIAVFRALIASDAERRYHRNFGQLGYALKDRVPPDVEGAIEMLTEAIRVRGADQGFVGYEFNRASARIGTGATATPAALRELILADLRVAASNSYWFERMSTQPNVAAWLAANGIVAGTLRTD